MISVNVLPDEVLLAVFDFFVDQDVDQGVHLSTRHRKKEIERWQPLVHVCRRWRSVVFESPHRLKLRLVCTVKTPARYTLGVWPALPLLIEGCLGFEQRFHNIMALLKHSDRVCQINLASVQSCHLEKLSAIQEPFPELTVLILISHGTQSVLSDLFLGGSAPRLRKLCLESIPFPGLPKLLLSATHLVYLALYSIPRSGYISPEAIVTTLSTLTALKILILRFLSPQSFPNLESRPPLPPTRFLLPVLTYFCFEGVSEYLNDLVARIDTPRVDKLYMILFNQIGFDTPQFIQFISRTPKFKALKKAHVAFDDSRAHVILSSKYRIIHVIIPCADSAEFNWQVSSASSLPPLSTLENLYIYENTLSPPDWQEDTENTAWLELLHPFSAVKNLYVSWRFRPLIWSAMQEPIGGRTTEVLPNLRNIFLEGLKPSGPDQEDVQQFVAARQASHHIAVSCWNDPWRETPRLY